jgi:hypothetical protein
MLRDIAALLTTTPFRAFSIETTDHNSYQIEKPAQVVIPPHGEAVHYHTQGGAVHMIAVRHIIRIVVGGGPLW